MRILGACDVYDALISTAVYRDAWTHEQALALLRSESGTAFDPGCVEALEAILARPEHTAVTEPIPPPVAARVPLVEPLLPSVPTVFASVPARIVRRP